MKAGQAARDLPLQGIVVLELGTIIAGPFAGSLLADLGATVVKVEAPGEGDGLRNMGPRVEGVPIWWGVASRGKQCVSLNLKTGAGRSTLERLVRKADVLIENYRPGVMERLGLGFAHLHDLNPSLVILSISGFGQTGPYALRAGFGKIAEGMSGVVPLTGEPGATPLFVGFSLADTAAGLFGALAVNVALYARESGRGTHIDLALYEPLLRILDAQLAGPGDPVRQGTNDPHGWGACADRANVMALCNDGPWLQVDLTAADARSRLRSLLGPGDGLLEAQLRAWCAARNCVAAQAGLAEADIPAVEVFDALRISSDPYFLQRGDVLQAEHPALGCFAVPGFVARAGGAPERPAFRSAAVGEDNHLVLTTLLGLPEAEFAALAAAGAFQSDDPGQRRQ